VETAAPNSVAALLYKNFPGPAPSTGDSLATYVTSDSVQCTTFDAACLASAYGITPGSALSTALLANANMPTFGPVNASASLFTKDQFLRGQPVVGEARLPG